MSFILQLSLPSELQPVPEEDRIYDEELDDIGSILHDVCRSLQDVPGIEFRVSICSSNPWPVTVQTELCLVMEQLCDVIRGLGSGSARLDFYEQGIERNVTFAAAKDYFSVACADMIPTAGSRTSTMTVTRRELIESLRELASNFVRAARACCPEKSGHPWFEKWSRELEQLALQMDVTG
jgi:hypothetical protein